jgi:hypothetical protein
MNEVDILITGRDNTGSAFADATAKESAFKAKFERDMAELSAKKTKIDVDIISAEEKIAALTRETETATKDRRVKINAEIAEAQAKIELLLLKGEELQHKMGDIKVKFDEANASNFFTGLESKATASGGSSGKGFTSAFMPALVTVGALLGPQLVMAAEGAAGAAGAAFVVGFGAYLQKDNPAVKAAAANLGAGFKAEFTRASAGLEQPLIDAMDATRDYMRRYEPQLKAMFDAAGKGVIPIVQGIDQLVKNALPGFTEFLQGLTPVFATLHADLPILGQELGSFFHTLGQVGPEMASGLDAILYGFTGIIEAVRRLSLVSAGFVDFLSGHWSAGMEKIQEATVRVSGVLNTFGDLVSLHWGNLLKDFKGAFTGIPPATTALQDMGNAAVTATADLQTLDNQLLAQRADARGFQQAIDDATAALKKNGNTLDIHTQKGRDNQAALDQVAASTLKWRQAVIDAGGSVQQQDAILANGRNSLYQMALKYGMSTTAAAAYVNQVLGIPKTANTAVAMSGMSAAAANAIYYKKLLGSIPRSIVVTISTVASKMPGGSVYNQQVPYAARHQEHGGVVGAAATGGARSGLTMVGEHGRELLDLAPGTTVHSNPDTERMLAQGGGPQTVVLEVMSAGQSAFEMFMLQAIRNFVRVKGGGNVQKAFGWSQ